MRETQRSRDQWLAIFEQQQQSGMTAIDFCKANAINIQTFYARRSDIRLQTQRSGFVKVKRKVTTIEQICSERGITLRTSNVQLALPADIDATWLATFVNALRQ